MGLFWVHFKQYCLLSAALSISVVVKKAVRLFVVLDSNTIGNETTMGVSSPLADLSFGLPFL